MSDSTKQYRVNRFVVLAPVDEYPYWKITGAFQDRYTAMVIAKGVTESGGESPQVVEADVDRKIGYLQSVPSPYPLVDGTCQ